MITNGYTIPPKGMGTDFAKSEQSREYAPVIRNRFINLTGQAERRLGFTALTASVSGNPNLTRLHEYVANNGDVTLLASTDTGTIYRYNGTTWSSAKSGLSNGRILSVQDNEKMIFFNGVDRNIYTDDAGLTFKDVVSIIVSGRMGGTVTTAKFGDSDVTDFSAIYVRTNDIVYNVTRNAYGYVTSTPTSEVNHSVIGTSGTGAGLAASNQNSGDAYIIIDTIANNIIDLGNGIKDNVATAGTGTNATTIAVSGVDFSTVGIRAGDFVINTTRTAVARVTAVGTNLTVDSITSQTSGDALVFVKDVMPITKNAHINWGRVYYMDATVPNTVRPSGRDDPFDLTIQSTALNAGKLDFGSLQPLGDNLLCMTTFQRFFAAAGSRYVYVFSGTDPVADTTSSLTSFSPVAVYPQGVVGRFCLGGTGNDLMFISNDGLNIAAVGSDNNSLVANNLNEFIKSVVRKDIQNNTDKDAIQYIFYPRRSWIIMKIDNKFWVFNIQNAVPGVERVGTWSYFDGPYTEMNHYLIRQNGDMIACGANGGVWLMDSTYSDNGTSIETEIEWPWLQLDDPNKQPRVKKGSYIKPAIESASGIEYNITAVAGLDTLSSSSVNVLSSGPGTIGSFVIGASTIGGSGVQEDKFPLRWRGEEVKIRITSNSTSGPDILAGFVLYGDIGGLC